MNLMLGILVVFCSLKVHGQQAEKGNSIIPFPRVGRNGNQPGLIPFPRIGRDNSGSAHEAYKRQLIPFPRVGKRVMWHFGMDPYTGDIDDGVSQYGGDSSVASLSNAYPRPDVIMNLQDNEEKRNLNSGNGMWFGPRLGKRRKRSTEGGSSGEYSREPLDSRTLAKILHNFNWALVPIKDRRTFTPRLGRSPELVVHRRGHFSPRLGRSRDDRGGREPELEEEGRAYEESKDGSLQHSLNGAPMSPRLGRDHYSPRLGRSGREN